MNSDSGTLLKTPTSRLTALHPIPRPPTPYYCSQTATPLSTINYSWIRSSTTNRQRHTGLKCCKPPSYFTPPANIRTCPHYIHTHIHLKRPHPTHPLSFSSSKALLTTPPLSLIHRKLSIKAKLLHGRQCRRETRVIIHRHFIMDKIRTPSGRDMIARTRSTNQRPPVIVFMQ